MCDRRAALLAAALAVAASPLSAQGSRELRALSRRLARESDSLARLDIQAPGADTVRIGGWTIVATDSAVAGAIREAPAALDRARRIYGADLVPQDVPVSVRSWGSGTRALEVSVGGSTVGDYRGEPGAGAIDRAIMAAVRAMVWDRVAGGRLQAWVATAQPLEIDRSDLALRSRIELAIVDESSVRSCRSGDTGACVAALGLAPGIAPSLGPAGRAGLLQLALQLGGGKAQLARLLKFKDAPVADQLVGLAGVPLDTLVAEWRRWVSFDGRSTVLDDVSAIGFSGILLALAVAGMGRRGV